VAFFIQIVMGKIKNKFSPGDKISKSKKSQVLEIEFIDYTRNVYVFKKEYIKSLSKFKSFDLEHIDNQFKLHDSN
jgi:hypothetical protein